MDEEQFQQFKKSNEEQIEKSIEKFVNGGIRGLRLAFDNHVANDTAWKKEAKPALDIMKKMQGFASISGFILKGILLIGGVGSSMYALYKFIVGK